MTTPINPWDFTPWVAAPFVLSFVLLLRRYYRKDGSGNKRQEEDPFAPTALILAATTLGVCALFFALRFLDIVIPYGSVIWGVTGLTWLGYALNLQRRPPPAPVKSSVLGPGGQKKAAMAKRKSLKATAPGRYRP